MKVLEAV